MATVLVTGANGEIGHGLLQAMAERGGHRVIALDLHAPDASVRDLCHRFVVGDILDVPLLRTLAAEHDFDQIFHLAALLSTKSEREPTLAHQVNVNGTLNLLELAVSLARRLGRSVRFLYPSSIAVYGLPSLEAKRAEGRIGEGAHLAPRTMYGINKLYCEQLGRYYSLFYRQLDAETPRGKVDFRGIRFPGLISAVTVPTGGTSDFAPEMLHHAAQGQPYACFVRPDTRIPFMAMPDAVQALVRLAAAPVERLSRQVYNVASFSPTAAELEHRVRAAFPAWSMTYEPDVKRQAILDSWPEDTDDSAARSDWGWAPEYDLDRAFDGYLLPGVRARYGVA
ncbi:MAG: NAD-dependent epimerase/dehydratase family protein [Fimbriimonadales bacterium]|nr:NAD-dependent epimerase/dehydratase family protein [Fimbriimonadales bacterium]